VSELHVNFIFQRYLMSVFFQSYFLAMSMVVLAGLGTWLDPTSVPGRVAVGMWIFHLFKLVIDLVNSKYKEKKI